MPPHYDETLSTVQFANRCRNVKNIVRTRPSLLLRLRCYCAFAAAPSLLLLHPPLPPVTTTTTPNPTAAPGELRRG